jgi:hypothetical protein
MQRTNDFALSFHFESVLVSIAGDLIYLCSSNSIPRHNLTLSRQKITDIKQPAKWDRNRLETS